MDRPLTQSQVSGPTRSAMTVAEDATLAILLLGIVASLATIVVLLARLAHT